MSIPRAHNVRKISVRYELQAMGAVLSHVGADFRGDWCGVVVAVPVEETLGLTGKTTDVGGDCWRRVGFGRENCAFP